MDPIIIISQLALTDRQLAALQQVSPRLQIYQYPSASLADIPADIQQQAEILFWHGSLMRETPNLPGLKWFQVGSAGIDYLMNSPVWDSDIAITNVSGIHLVLSASWR